MTHHSVSRPALPTVAGQFQIGTLRSRCVRWFSIIAKPPTRFFIGQTTTITTTRRLLTYWLLASRMSDTSIRITRKCNPSFVYYAYLSVPYPLTAYPLSSSIYPASILHGGVSVAEPVRMHISTCMVHKVHICTIQILPAQQLLRSYPKKAWCV